MRSAFNCGLTSPGWSAWSAASQRCIPPIGDKKIKASASNGIDDIGDLPVDADEPLLSFLIPLAVHRIQPLLLSVIFGKEAHDSIWRQQSPPDACKHTLFEVANTDRPAVGADTFLTMRSTGQLVLVLHGIGSATAAAAYEP